MSAIHIKFSGLDESAGAVFLQFATDETLEQINQSTIHGFFPSQYKSQDITELLSLMAEFGQQMLSQQMAIVDNRFTQEQLSDFNQLLGTIQRVTIDSMQPGIEEKNNPYHLDSLKNPNSQVDQMRNIVLEILAEEGLIIGKIK
ncbi:hypothetical protein Meth11DRAFT_1150 [Methylophilaceae bacterium 11]|nr:hypothetical protein Meth11DRAFT_1150 [Methylophilaceae bacterium 11]